MTQKEINFWCLIYNLTELVEEKISSTGSKRKISKSAQTVAGYFREKLKDEGFLKSIESDNIWWSKTGKIFDSCLNRGLTQRDLKEIIDLAFTDEGYKAGGFIIHPAGLVRNFEPRWMQKNKPKKVEKTISRRNLKRFLGD